MIDQMLSRARATLRDAPPLGDAAYLRYPGELAAGLRRQWPMLCKANEMDLAEARERGLSPELVDRLRLGPKQLSYVEELAEEVTRRLPEVTAMSAPVPAGDWGTVSRVPKPLGVLLMIYEARPTVTVEGALLPPATGNVALLRGGREIANTNSALATVVSDALVASGLPAGMVTIIEQTDRAVLRELLGRGDAIDVLLPRGGPSLIDYCRTASRIPVIASGGGVNHLYVHRDADLGLAARAALDSKLAEPTACNTVELVLAHREIAAEFVAALRAEAREPVTLRVDPAVESGVADPAGPVALAPLDPRDFGREFLDATIGVLAVDGVDAALAHIAEHGSAHTEGVLAADQDVIDRFVRGVDAAAVVVNGSLRLHDGPTLGLGPELSISTGRLHVRGSVGLTALVTHSWLVRAGGTLRAHLDRRTP